jgi:hypothetical protein
MLDGSPILRPCVEVATGAALHAYVGVVDSGSPICVADPALVAEAGVDIEATEPTMTVPLGMGASFSHVPMFEIRLSLLPPEDVDAAPVPWSLLVAARGGWRFPFAILLGQLGWFDTFPTMIDAAATTVVLS